MYLHVCIYHMYVCMQIYMCIYVYIIQTYISIIHTFSLSLSRSVWIVITTIHTFYYFLYANI